ncbi:MAG: hypothetical protein AB7O52_14695 [Planctomycetota bacterium]
MPTRAVLNGQLWEAIPTTSAAWPEWVARLRAHVTERGWSLLGVRVNGVETSLERLERLAPTGVQEIVVEAGPAEFQADHIERQIAAAMPAFRSQLTELGERFSRGDWRTGLAQLPALLEELRVALAGLQMVYAARSEEPPIQLERIPEALRGLSQQIELQSWVEVSDCILYEVLPLFESWNPSPHEQE